MSDALNLSFSDVANSVQVLGAFDPRSSLSLSDSLWKRLKSRAPNVRLKIAKMGDSAAPPILSIRIGDFSGSIQILAGSSGSVDIGNCGQLNLDLRVGHGSVVQIGDKCTANGARIVAVNSEITLGTDCMLSDEVLVQGFDQHGIVDLTTMKIVNNVRKEISVGDHVWIGRRATIMPGVSIGKGAIVGACAVVTKDIPQCCLAVGVPAKVQRTAVSWTRPWGRIDEDSKNFFSGLDGKKDPIE